VITDVQLKIRHPVLRWMGATLDGRVEGSDAVFEAKFMLPWSFSEEAAAEKYMPQLLDYEIFGQVLRLDFASLLAPETNKGRFVIAHDYAGVRAADEDKVFEGFVIAVSQVNSN
jgi:hypothetical protein